LRALKKYRRRLRVHEHALHHDPRRSSRRRQSFHPKVVIPYHYKGSDPKVFAKALEGSGIEVRLLDWYPKLPGE